MLAGLAPVFAQLSPGRPGIGLGNVQKLVEQCSLAVDGAGIAGGYLRLKLPQLGDDLLLPPDPQPGSSDVAAVIPRVATVVGPRRTGRARSAVAADLASRSGSLTRVLPRVSPALGGFLTQRESDPSLHLQLLRPVPSGSCPVQLADQAFEPADVCCIPD